MPDPRKKQICGRLMELGEKPALMAVTGWAMLVMEVTTGTVMTRKRKAPTALPSVHLQQDKGNEPLPASVGRAVHSQVSPSGVCCPPRAEEPWRNPQLAVTKVGNQSRSNYLSQTGSPGGAITQEKAVKEKPILRSLHSLLSAWIPRGGHSLQRILGAFPLCWIFC